MMTRQITVYDPYLYSGKFSTASRKSAGVVVSGNSAYVTESAFKTYANYKCFWVFSNDQGSGNTSTSSSSTSSSTSSSVKSVNYTRYVATQSNNLNVRSGAGTNYKVTASLARGTTAKVTKVDGSWSYITSPVTGWVSTSYLSSTKPTSYSTTVGKTYTLKSRTYLYSKGSLSGTKVKVIKHYSTTVDYVYISATKRYAYVKVSAFK